jgi:hypothetical protein
LWWVLREASDQDLLCVGHWGTTKRGKIELIQRYN